MTWPFYPFAVNPIENARGDLNPIGKASPKYHFQLHKIFNMYESGFLVST